MKVQRESDDYKVFYREKQRILNTFTANNNLNKMPF